MAKHDGEVDREVKVHVTYFGGMYVDPGELLRSEAARETMGEMNRILREERNGRQTTGGDPSAREAAGEQ